MNHPPGYISHQTCEAMARFVQTIDNLDAVSEYDIDNVVIAAMDMLAKIAKEQVRRRRLTADKEQALRAQRQNYMMTGYREGE